jgi:hypothetical protein
MVSGHKSVRVSGCNGMRGCAEKGTSGPGCTGVRVSGCKGALGSGHRAAPGAGIDVDQVIRKGRIAIRLGYYVIINSH